MGFRDLGLGRIVGNPTAAAVIATGSYRLINGGSIRTPGSLVITYDPDEAEQLRHQPRELRRGAGRLGARTRRRTSCDGFDRELKAAVDEALRMLREGKWQYTAEGMQR